MRRQMAIALGVQEATDVRARTLPYFLASAA